MGGRLPSGSVNAPLHTPDWYLDHLRHEVTTTNRLLDGADLDAVVPSCPGWSVAQLVDHVGAVFGWANSAASTAERPAGFPMHADDEAPLIEWFAGRAATLIDTLDGLDPEGATWHHWPTDKLNRVWQRRMAQEITVHRWDLEGALGVTGAIDAELASDGIDEFLELYLPRPLGRDGAALPTGSLHLHCTDVEGEWLLELVDGEYRLTRAHQKGAAALRGPAETLLLWSWGRAPTSHDALSPVGDDQVLAEWAAFMGS